MDLGLRTQIDGNATAEFVAVHQMSLDEKRKAVDYVTNQQTLSPDLMPQPA